MHADNIKASFATDGPPVPAPDGLALLPYQRGGVAYALRAMGQFGACLIADAPGLGKTIQALAVTNELALDRVLIVCPASLRLNWAREAARWLFYAEPVIVGYEELARHPDRAAGRWPLAVFDEAQYLKNGEAKRTVASLGVAAQRRLFLSGTPIVNRPIELWPALNALQPGAWGSLHDFGVRYCGAYLKWIGSRSVWQYTGASNLPELQSRLRSTIMVRRLKEAVLKDLPPKRRQVIELPALPGSAKAMAELDALSKDAANDERAAMRYRGRLAQVRHEQALAKVPAAAAHILTLLESLDKVVVFAHHRDVLEALALAVGADGAAIVRVVGGMSDAEKQESVDRFQTGSARVFLGQIQAAGVGLTLTAASTVVFVELDWTPGGMTQCEDRCHRIGQRDSVLVQHLHAAGSFDVRLARALVRKQSILDQTLDSAAASADLDPVATLAESAEE